jgi:hypothetical protein
MEDVLGVPQILELIEAEGEFLQSVKKEYLLNILKIITITLSYLFIIKT